MIKDQKVFFLAQFILELNLLEYKMLTYRSSVLVVAAFYLATKILYSNKGYDYSLGEELKVTDADVRNCAKFLCALLLNKVYEKTFVIKKFSCQKYLYVAVECLNKLKSINAL